MLTNPRVSLAQFVNFTTVLERTIQESPDRREACFALNALMELPDQYAAIGKLNLIGRRVEDQRPPQWRRPPLDPPGVPPPSGGIAGPSPAIFAAQNARLATEQTGPVDPVWFECPISKEVRSGEERLGTGDAAPAGPL